MAGHQRRSCRLLLHVRTGPLFSQENLHIRLEPKPLSNHCRRLQRHNTASALEEIFHFRTQKSTSSALSGTRVRCSRSHFSWCLYSWLSLLSPSLFHSRAVLHTLAHKSGAVGSEGQVGGGPDSNRRRPGRDAVHLRRAGEGSQTASRGKRDTLL